MGLRFAILKEINAEGDEKIVLEYDQDILKKKLLINTKRNLLREKRRLFRGLSEEQILDSVRIAFSDLVNEFKQESIRIK